MWKTTKSTFTTTINSSSSSRSTVSVNGHKIEIVNGRFFVNGKEYVRKGDGPSEPIPTPESSAKKLELDGDGRIVGDIYGGIEVHGNNVTLVIEGNVDGPVSTTGNITCRDLDGTVSAGGNIKAKDIDGTVSAGGNVTAKSVDGIINAVTYTKG